MYEVKKTGVFLATDEHGHLLSDADADKIVSPWREAIDYARDLEILRLGNRLHSLYLRGSVARGTAIPGRSDIDLFAVLFDDSAPRPAPPEFGDFLGRYPFVAGIESSHITLANIHGPFHYYRFVMKVSAVCIHGEDLLPAIAPCTTDLPVAQEWFRIFPHVIAHIVTGLKQSSEETEKMRFCLDLMKAFLRAGMLLVMKRWRAYTRDLYPSYQSFSTYYPEQEPAMKRCLEFAVNPTSDPQLLLPFATDLAEWMQRAAEAEFGTLELLPASLVR
jgi:uncharacterized protein